MFPYSNTKVTLELRDVLASVDENGQPFKLWDFDYPSYYQGEAKAAFEQKVIDHYFFHQIGVETIGRFKHNFKSRIREIMPYYMQYYKSVEIMDGIDDPFGNVDITETFEQTSTGTSSGTSSNTESGTSSTTSTESGSTSSTNTESGTSSTTNTESGSTSSTNTETGTSSSTNTESGTSSSNETATKTDNKTASEDSEHRFSNTPQGDIDNISAYLTEASRDNKDQTEEINSNGTVKTENENERTNTGSGETSSTVIGSGETSSEGTSETENEHTATATGETSSTVMGSGESASTFTGSTESENSGTVKHTLTRKGNQGVNTYAHDMIEYRQSFINVDMMVIGALRDLFLLVY